MEYSRKMDWQINNNVKVELVKRWIDVQKLRIASSKGIVEIRGALGFTGKNEQSMEIPAIMGVLKTLDMVLKGLPNVRDVKWHLDNWQKLGVNWQLTKVGEKEQKKKEE